ncbi:FkbM family methyltransferase [Acidobacteria bacterium AB60]|nr:FkbM family methyltransferase [Acidobacteria bacterium AB60]
MDEVSLVGADASDVASRKFQAASGGGQGRAFRAARVHAAIQYDLQIEANMVKRIVKALLPDSVKETLRQRRNEQRERDFRRHPVVTMQCGEYTLEIPSNHLLREWSASQPFRDRCVGITAKFMVEKYRDATVIDIGANIGDTAAIIASYAKPRKLIAVEASDFFFRFLERNVGKLPGDVVCRRALVSDRAESISGSLAHWGGTASFKSGSGDESVPSVPLRDLVDDRTVFVKTDTDGFDFKICLGAIDWIAEARPAVLLEDQLSGEQDRELADTLFKRLNEVGYRNFAVWDDQGFMLLATSSLEILADLHRYLAKIAQHKGHKSIYNYDVLCLHERDQDVFEKVCQYYREN